MEHTEPTSDASAREQSGIPHGNGAHEPPASDGPDKTPDAPSPPPDVPVAGADRIRSLDLLRGVAVLGILLINIWTFALPFPAAMDPNLAGFDGIADQAAYAFVYLVGYSKMMPIFSMLFGAGILLFTGRVEARGGRSGRRWFARQWWLLVIGLAHGYLLWSGDILVPYAVAGLILYRLRRLKPRTLLILAFIAMFLPKLGMYGGSIFMEHARDTAVEADAIEATGGGPSAQQERLRDIWTNTGRSWSPDAEQFAETVERMRGGYGGILAGNASELVIMHVFMYPLTAGWVIAGYMMIGMVLFKTNILQGGRSDRFYTGMVLAGYGFGLTGSFYGLHFMDVHFTDIVMMLRFGFALTDVTGPLVSLGHIGLIVLAGRRGWLGGLERRLVATGRMAFTNYLTQTVIGVTLFYGYGFGLFGSLSRVAMLGVMVAIWAVQLLWSPWWLARFRFGPAEWFWRTLTYGRRQPFARGIPPEALGAAEPTAGG